MLTTVGSPTRFEAHMCRYHGFLDPDPLFNKFDTRADPLPVPPHEATQGGPLY